MNARFFSISPEGDYVRYCAGTSLEKKNNNSYVLTSHGHATVDVRGEGEVTFKP